MKHVRVRITAGGRGAEIHPMYDVWANASFIDRATAIQWNFTGDALGILHYAVGDADEFKATVEDIPEVVGYDLVRDGEDAFYVYIRDETTEALGDLFGPITQRGLLVIPPIRYHEDGTVSFALFGLDEEIQAALETVPAPVDVSIEEISGLKATTATVETRLSERQREAMETAVERGYYDIPRSATVKEVAEVIGCSQSTAAEHLQKAESALMKSLFG